MEIHCYSCGLGLGEVMAELETAATALDDLGRVVVREHMAETVFRQLPPASFCSYCLTAIVAFTDVFTSSTTVPHSRFELRVSIYGHSSAAEWATCKDCGVTLREPCPHADSQLPPDVRLRRRMLLHCAAMHYGHNRHTRALGTLLDHRDGA